MKADVLARVDTLSNQQADPTTAERFYREVVIDFGQMPLLMVATLVQVGPGLDTPPNHSYPLPDTAIQPWAWFYEDTRLPEAAAKELFQWGNDWRNRTGVPLVIYREDPGLRRFRLVPLPAAPVTGPFIFLHGAPFGTDFPDSAVAIIHTEDRTDVPLWLEPAVAWFILAREFSRDSDHQDSEFAARCMALANAELTMVQ